jgi:uncharacterized protein (TIGR01777 family)
MKVILTGGSGLIGETLSHLLEDNGHVVLHLRRWYSNKQSVKKDLTSKKNIFWSNPEILEGADAVIHLAGANVAKPWTKSYKREILRSRTEGTSALIDACMACNQPPKQIISASGIGYYPESLSIELNEDHTMGDAFLAQVCVAWENSLQRPFPLPFQVSIVRTGLVLSNKSKIVQAAQSQFLLSGMVGSVGSHENQWSWIHILDLCNLYIALAEQKLLSGIYNGVSPNPCTQGEFGKVYEMHASLQLPWYLSGLKLQWWVAKGLNRLIRTLNIQQRPIVPTWVMRLAWGERAAIALTNQKVSTNKTLDQGFCYQYPTIEKALQHLQAHPKV